MSLQVETKDPVVIATVMEPTIDAQNGSVFREELKDILKDKVYLVLDLKNLTFIDSSGIGAILSCMRFARSQGGEIILAEPTANVHAILNILQMTRVINVCQSKDEAVDTLKNLSRNISIKPHSA